VDHIVSFEEESPTELIRLIGPGVFAKGGDYPREFLPEAPLVESLGGTVQILPYEDDSSNHFPSGLPPTRSLSRAT
ncbi:MAG: hypothetical protein KGJ11_02585, partial [Candidatus Omnitrophica bacterium]|nr:hypothetical protein [Candidatus Omnitrophota bacterium]